MCSISSADSVVAGVLFGCLIFGGCDTTLVLVLLALAVMFSGASLAGTSANVVDISPNFCGKTISVPNDLLVQAKYLFVTNLIMLLLFQL